MNEKEFASYLDTWIPAHKREILDFLLGLLKINSVGADAVDGKPFGAEVDDAFRFYLNKAKDLDMTVKDVDGHAVHAEVGSGKEMAMALTHIDIVPVGDGWTKDPFGEVSDGTIYGRGAQDNKGPTTACLFAMKALVDSGAPLKRRVRHVVGGNEESGFRCVRHYFEVEEQPTYGFSPDAAFPLVFAEKGSMNVVAGFEVRGGGAAAVSGDQSGKARVISFEGGDRVNIVGPWAKATLSVPEGKEDEIILVLKGSIDGARALAGGPGPLEFEFENGKGTVKVSAKGKGAHAASPSGGTNAITGLAFILAGLRDRLEFSEAFGFAAEAAEIYGKGLNIESSDDVSGRLSCNLGLARTEEAGGKKVIRCTYNIRFPVKVDGESLKQRALSCKRPAGIAIEVPNVGKSHYTDPESYIVKALLKVYREETGDMSPPIAIGGGTYARVINSGVAFGPVLPGAPEVAHQADERISLDDLWFMVRVYARALFALGV